MTNNPATEADVYIATESAALQLDGQPVIVHKDKTRVRAGHKLLKLYPEHFKPIDVHFDVVDRRANPSAATARKGKPGK